MNPAEGLKDEESGILNEVLQASNQEEVIHKDLGDKKHVTQEYFSEDIITNPYFYLCMGQAKKLNC